MDKNITAKNHLIFGFSILGFIILLFFGLDNLFFLKDSFSGIIEVTLCSVLLVNFIIFGFKKNTSSASYTLIIILFVALIFAYMGGGIGGKTGILWFFTFPITVIFLLGDIEGLVWTSFFILSIVFIYLFSSTPFSLIETRQLIASVIVALLLVRFYWRVNNSIANNLKIKTAELKKYSDLLNTSVVEEKAKNHNLEKTKQTITNRLENVNREKGLEESQSRSILENTSEGIVLTNEEGKIKYTNPAFEKISGYPASELKGKIFAEKPEIFDLNGNKIPIFERSDAAMVSAGAKRERYTLMTKSNQKHPVIINSTPVKLDNSFMGVVRIFHDFSDEAKLEQQKDDFFSIASHELRTPLTVISGNLDILSEYLGKMDLNKELKQLLKDTEESADRLKSMVEDFLNVSRLDQGRLKLDLVEADPCRLVQDAVESVRALATIKGLTINLTCATGKLKARVDVNLFTEIVVNLIGNSIKFTDEGEIKLKQYVKGGQLYTTFTDTGIGIAETSKEKLFQRFQQAMSRTTAREAGGTGLGLYISREFARLMGGDLYLVKSELGKGSSFELRTPLIS